MKKQVDQNFGQFGNQSLAIFSKCLENLKFILEVDHFRGDWLLKFLYRTVNVKLRVAGLGPVKWDNRRMHNIDLTDVVSMLVKPT